MAREISDGRLEVLIATVGRDQQPEWAKGLGSVANESKVGKPLGSGSLAIADYSHASSNLAFGFAMVGTLRITRFSLTNMD